MESNTTPPLDFTFLVTFPTEETYVEAERLPEELRIIMMTLLIIIFVIGTVGNVIAIIVFLTTKSLRSPANYMIVSLCFSDFFMLSSNLPFMWWSIHKGYWYFEDIGCQIYAFAGAIFSFASITCMAAISVDRYYVICHCFEAMQTVSPKRTTYIIVVVWIYASIWAVLPFVGVGAYIDEGWGIGCTFDFVTQDFNTQLYVGLLVSCGFFTPVFIIIACYTKIVQSVKSHKKEMGRLSAKSEGSRSSKAVSGSGGGGGGGGQEAESSKGVMKKLGKLMQEYQIAKVGITATVIFCISWGPYGVMAIYSEYFHTGEAVSPLIRLAPVTMAKASAIWNPFVYAISHRRFKSSLASFLRKRCPCLASKLVRKQSSKTSVSNVSDQQSVRRAVSHPGGLSTAGIDVATIDKQANFGTTSTLAVSTIELNTPTGETPPTNLVETLSLQDVREMGKQKI